MKKEVKITVKAVMQSEPDMARLARLFIAQARAELQTETAAKAQDKGQVAS